MKLNFLELQKMMELPHIDDESLSQWVARSSKIEFVKRLQGDASTRRYYRIRFSGQKESYILMKTEPFDKTVGAMPFLEVQAYLDRVGISVPAVINFDPDLGIILLEDLGDTTLLHRLKHATNFEIEKAIYKKALDLLVDFQVKANPNLNPKVKVSGFDLRFDFEKLYWEVNFTLEHFYQLYLKRTIKDADKIVFETGFSSICSEIAKCETVFTHRDFHSRNIMVTHGVLPEKERLVMIDFQDARLGPPQYDLASLLKDSYYQLDEEQVSLLIQYYLDSYERQTGTMVDRGRFIYIFDLMSVQRNFKAIGSFASFLNRRSDATYLKYIGNTFENIRRVLLKYPQYSSLREVLFHYYYF